jgi:hypothetical protein
MEASKNALVLSYSRTGNCRAAVKAKKALKGISFKKA